MRGPTGIRSGGFGVQNNDGCTWLEMEDFDTRHGLNLWISPVEMGGLPPPWCVRMGGAWAGRGEGGGEVMEPSSAMM